MLQIRSLDEVLGLHVVLRIRFRARLLAFAVLPLPRLAFFAAAAAFWFPLGFACAPCVAFVLRVLCSLSLSSTLFLFLVWLSVVLFVFFFLSCRLLAASGVA